MSRSSPLKVCTRYELSISSFPSLHADTLFDAAEVEMELDCFRQMPRDRQEHQWQNGGGHVDQDCAEPVRSGHLPDCAARPPPHSHRVGTCLLCSPHHPPPRFIALVTLCSPRHPPRFLAWVDLCSPLHPPRLRLDSFNLWHTVTWRATCARPCAEVDPCHLQGVQAIWWV